MVAEENEANRTANNDTTAPSAEVATEEIRLSSLLQIFGDRLLLLLLPPPPPPPGDAEWMS
jgi:hypothetical protein